MGVYPRSVPEYGLNVCKLLILYSFFVFAVGEEIFQCGGVWSIWLLQNVIAAINIILFADLVSVNSQEFGSVSSGMDGWWFIQAHFTKLVILIFL